MQGTSASQICRHSGTRLKTSRREVPVGVRSTLCHDVDSACHGVEDDDYLLVMGSRVVTENLAWQSADAFIQASYVPKEQERGIPP